MAAVYSLLIVVALSLLIVRTGAVAFRMTGLSEEVARFQSLSAFSGAGFTTDEAEAVTQDPARRRVAVLLIRLGSVGAVTSIATLLLSFVDAGEATPERLLVLIAGIGALITLARSRLFNRLLTPIIEGTLDRYTTLELRDYADLLGLREDYRVVEIEVAPDTWLADRNLADLDLPSEGVLVLGVSRPGENYIGAPPADLCLRPEDQLIVYGREHRLDELATRASGDTAARGRAVADHERDLADQREQLGDQFSKAPADEQASEDPPM